MRLIGVYVGSAQLLLQMTDNFVQRVNASPEIRCVLLQPYRPMSYNGECVNAP